MKTKSAAKKGRSCGEKTQRRHEWGLGGEVPLNNQIPKRQGFPDVQAFQVCGLDGEPSVQAIAPENWNELEGIARSDGFMLRADDGEELGYSE